MIDPLPMQISFASSPCARVDICMKHFCRPACFSCAAHAITHGVWTPEYAEESIVDVTSLINVQEDCQDNCCVRGVDSTCMDDKLPIMAT